MKKATLIWLAASCFLLPAISFGDIIADSAADFSEVQGQNGWFNGLYNQTTDPDGTYGVGDFQPFMEPDYAWNGSAWDFTGGNVPWTTINAEGGHPNGDNNGDVHYAVRRWVSDTSGSATVEYNIAAQNLGGGAGTTAILYYNGAEISKTTVGGTDGVGQVVSEMLTLSSGDVLDLALTPQNVDGTFGDGSDGSFFGMTVDLVPEPGSLALIGLGFLGLLAIFKR